MTIGARIVAVDWSGARVGTAHRIWRADVVGGELVYLANGHSQDEITAQLIDLARSEPAVIAGLDFAFSMPAWFLEREGIASAPELWRRAAEDNLTERWLADCEPPFWGRPGMPMPRDGERYRRCEREVHATTSFLPKSVFQVGGAGAVGTASLRGMRALHGLHEAGFHIWPYAAVRDESGPHTVIEIYPRVFTGPVRKSRADARATCIDARGDIPARFRDSIVASEDAFDAAISALEMARHESSLRALPDARDAIERLEGAIWLPPQA